MNFKKYILMTILVLIIFDVSSSTIYNAKLKIEKLYKKQISTSLEYKVEPNKNISKEDLKDIFDDETPLSTYKNEYDEKDNIYHLIGITMLTINILFKFRKDILKKIKELKKEEVKS